MVRLKNGEKFGEGRVEIYHSHSQKWLQVCGEQWDREAADVACRQRGFLGAHAGTDSYLEYFIYVCRRTLSDFNISRK